MFSSKRRGRFPVIRVCSALQFRFYHKHGNILHISWTYGRVSVQGEVIPIGQAATCFKTSHQSAVPSMVLNESQNIGNHGGEIEKFKAESMCPMAYLQCCMVSCWCDASGTSWGSHLFPLVHLLSNNKFTLFFPDISHLVSLFQTNQSYPHCYSWSALCIQD